MLATDLIPNGPGTEGLFWRISKIPSACCQPLRGRGARCLHCSRRLPHRPKRPAITAPDWIYELKGPPVPAKIMPRAKDTAAAARLWDVSAALTGVSFGQVRRGCLSWIRRR